MENNLQQIKEFINIWKEKALEYYLKAIVDCKKDLEEYYQLSGQARRTKGLELKQKYNETIREFARYKLDKPSVIKFIEKEGETKERKLIARVNKAVGNILEAKSLNVGVNGELNGKILGEKGTCTITTIYAGGYNIQCLHYRVLVHIIK